MASLKDFTISMYLQLKAEDQSVVDQLLTDHLVMLQPTDTLDVVIRKFYGAKIISAPVKLSNGTFQFVTLLDVLTAIEDIADPVIFQIPIENFCNFSGIVDYAIIKNDKTLFDVVALLADKHRVLIVDADEKPVSIFSQFDLIAFLVRHPQYIPEKINLLPAGHVMTTNPATVHVKDNVLDAFKICANKKYHGIAVLDDQNQLVGNLSVSALQYLTPENFRSLLSLNVGRFLEETQHYHKLPVFVHYGDHIDSVAKTMRNNHIHRVFVVDDNKKPIGVVSSSDLVNLLASSLLEKERPTATGV